MKYTITDIKWDTDDDEEILATLPKSIELKGDEFPEEAYGFLHVFFFICKKSPKSR